MNIRLSSFFEIVILGILVTPVFADPEDADSNKRELTQEEIDASIGRFGEPEVIPEDFQYADAETKLWLDEHLKNIDRPVRLYYEFIKSGTYEEGFTDAVYLDIIKINDDGTKNASLDFFTADRKQVVSPDNVTNITGNPVLGIYMQGDIYEMNRLTEGHWRYFQKRIKIALREDATIEPVNFEFNGEQYQGEKISFSPYMKDPHRSDFEKFAGKHYEFILSEQIPGKLFQIKTIIPNEGESTTEPLILETLTLIETNFKD